MPIAMGEEPDPDSEGIRRRRRSAEPSIMIQVIEFVAKKKCLFEINARVLQMNELSRKILLSIDAVQIAEKDNGKCMRNAICENNKYSRDLNNNQKLWIPVWG